MGEQTVEAVREQAEMDLFDFTHTDHNGVDNGGNSSYFAMWSYHPEMYLGMNFTNGYYYSVEAMKVLRDKLIELYPLETPVEVAQEEPAAPLDLTRRIVTRDGRDVKIILTDVAGPRPIVALIGESVFQYTPAGRISDVAEFNIPELDLMNYVEPVVKQTAYLNVYAFLDGSMFIVGGANPNRKVADSFASPSRVGCVRVDLVKGQFDA